MKETMANSSYVYNVHLSL